MILTVDIGNSNIVIGLFQGDKPLFSARFHTDKSRLCDEYALDLKSLFELHRLAPEIEGAVLSSVVPSLTRAMSNAIQTVTGIAPLVIAPGIKTGLNITIDNPSQLGSDILADAVGAAAQYPLPILLIDLGTASTITLIDEKKNIRGCAILPGVRLSLEALSRGAAQLTDISLDPPKDIIGTNTAEAMRSGLVFGTASMIDGMIDRFSERIGAPLTPVATGGLSEFIIPHCRHEIRLDPELQLKGLLNLYTRNQK